MTTRDIGPGQSNFSAKCTDVGDFLLRHFVRDDENDAVAFCGRDQRETEPGVAGGSFDDCAARRKLTVALRRLDHGKCDPVLDRAGWILIFQFKEEMTGPGVDSR